MSGHFQPADRWKRAAAAMIDMGGDGLVIYFVPVVGPILGSAYRMMRDGFGNGAGLGKWLLGLKVVDHRTGATCQMKASLLRNLPLTIGFLLSIVPVLGHAASLAFVVFLAKVELLMILFSSSRRRLGDHLAGTSVVLAHPVQLHPTPPHE